MSLSNLPCPHLNVEIDRSGWAVCVVSESVEYGRVGVVISGLVAIAYMSGYGRFGVVISGLVAIYMHLDMEGLVLLRQDRLRPLMCLNMEGRVLLIRDRLRPLMDRLSPPLRWICGMCGMCGVGDFGSRPTFHENGWA
jgi:hypothetical protein